MTTIVAHSEGMASDSSLQMKNTISSLKAKKIYRIKGCLVGSAGSCAICQHLINDLTDSKDPPVLHLRKNPNTKYDGARILVLDTKGKIWEYNGAGAPFRINDEYATIGSGQDIARAALMAGATVQEAVRIAMQLDVSSNGRMKYVKL